LALRFVTCFAIKSLRLTNLNYTGTVIFSYKILFTSALLLNGSFFGDLVTVYIILVIV